MKSCAKSGWVLLCAVLMFGVCQMASANTDNTSDAVVISFEPSDVVAAEAVPANADMAALGQAVLGNMVKVEGVRRVAANAGIPSSNPDDATGHVAWRKRAADASKVGMATLRQAMMMQAAR